MKGAIAMFFKKRNDPEAKLKEAEEYKQRGVNFVNLGQYDKAEEAYLKCLSILEPLSRKSEPETVMQERAVVYNLLSLLRMGKNTTKEKLNEAAGWAKKAVEINEKLVAKKRTPDLLDKLAYSYSNLGYAAGDFFAGNKALEMWTELQKSYPINPVFADRVERQKRLLQQMAQEYGL